MEKGEKGRGRGGERGGRDRWGDEKGEKGKGREGGREGGIGGVAGMESGKRKREGGGWKGGGLEM